MMVGPDHQQARVFALRAGVRLQRHRGEAGDLAEVRLEPPEQFGIAGGLRPRRERMHAPNSGQLTGIISAVALSFMVQMPSGIIADVSERSFASSPRR